MPRIFTQGYLDGFCGVYSIINADKILNKSSENDSQLLFNKIVSHLSHRKKLKEVLLYGINHKLMTDILQNVAGDRFPIKLTTRSSQNLTGWWKDVSAWLEIKNRCVIASFGGKISHLTVITAITEKIIFLSDSSGMKKINKSSLRYYGYTKDDKYVVYPAQCFYIGKE